MNDACDVLVVGAGPAGVEAALAAARHGLAVMLVDEAREAGGQVYRAPPRYFHGGFLDGADAVGVQLRRRLVDSRVQSRFDHVVWSVSPGFRVDALGAEGPVSWRARSVIAATGAQERVVPFPGWTLPGVNGLAGATVLLKSQRILPGRRTLVAGQGPLLIAVATAILKAGGEVAAVVDLASRGDWLRDWSALAARPDLAARGALWQAQLLRAGVRMMHRHAIRQVQPGRDGALLATIGAVDAAGGPAPGPERSFVVDAVTVGNGLTPSSDITRLLRAQHHYDGLRGGWVPSLDGDFRTSLPGLYVAGDGAGLGGAAAAEMDGRLAGLAAALDLGALSIKDHAREVVGLRYAARRARRFGRAMARLMALRPAQVAAITRDTIVCRCEDVTRGEIDAAAEEGARTVNQLKAWTRCGMGACQGRICGDIVGSLLAGALGDRERAGLFTGRAPFRPLPLDRLAGKVDYAELKLPQPAPL